MACVYMCLVTQSCPTLCRLMGCSLPDSSFHGIFQARIIEWVAISNWVGGNLPHPGIELDLLHLLHWQAGSLSLVPPEKTLLRLQHSLNWTIDSTWVSKWVKVTQTCPTLCDPMDYTLRGILQARILEWVAFPFSRGSSQPRSWTQVSHIAGGFFTSWATREAQEYWRG